MSRRRATGFAVIAVLTALVASLLVGTAPARAEVRTLTTSYSCESDEGSGTSAVRVRVNLPDRVKVGERVDSRRITFRIRVPAEILARLRQFSVDEVAATALARYRVGSERIPIRDLAIPRTDVPEEGRMILRGSGRAGGFTIAEPGRYAVKAPRGFTAEVTAYGGAISPITVDMTCALADGAPARLWTLRVVR